MEKVLDIYHRDYDEEHPVLCFDERPCQLIGNLVAPIPAKQGMPRREDYHYLRSGMAVALLAIEPLSGRRIVEISRRKSKKEYAEFLDKIMKAYPKAKSITLVQDNLSTHGAASFYESFDAQKAFKMSNHFEMVFTPKKASWLNMAEIEFSAMSKQCLDRRIGDIETLTREVSAWVKTRNRQRIKIRWQFGLKTARSKFRKYYDGARN